MRSPTSLPIVVFALGMWLLVGVNSIGLAAGAPTGGGGPQVSYDVKEGGWSYHLMAEVPSAPTGLQATPGDGRVTLFWDEPLSDGGSLITGYKVYRGTTTANLGFLATSPYPWHNDQDLTNGVAYHYQVSAVNGAGESPRSEIASATPTGTPPEQPPEDATSPNVAIASPLDNAHLDPTASVLVAGTAADDVGVEKVELSTDSVNWVLAIGTTEWTGIVSLAVGPNMIYARATDTSGNTATRNIAVIVEAALPPPSTGLSSDLLVLIGIGAAVVAIAAVIAVLFWRQRASS